MSLRSVWCLDICIWCENDQSWVINRILITSNSYHFTVKRTFEDSSYYLEIRSLLLMSLLSVPKDTICNLVAVVQLLSSPPPFFLPSMALTMLVTDPKELSRVGLAGDGNWPDTLSSGMKNVPLTDQSMEVDIQPHRNFEMYKPRLIQLSVISS